MSTSMANLHALCAAQGGSTSASPGAAAGAAFGNYGVAAAGRNRLYENSSAAQPATNLITVAAWQAQQQQKAEAQQQLQQQAQQMPPPPQPHPCTGQSACPPGHAACAAVTQGLPAISCDQSGTTLDTVLLNRTEASLSIHSPPTRSVDYAHTETESLADRIVDVKVTVDELINFQLRSTENLYKLQHVLERVETEFDAAAPRGAVYRATRQLWDLDFLKDRAETLHRDNQAVLKVVTTLMGALDRADRSSGNAGQSSADVLVITPESLPDRFLPTPPPQLPHSQCGQMSYTPGQSSGHAAMQQMVAAATAHGFAPQLQQQLHSQCACAPSQCACSALGGMDYVGHGSQMGADGGAGAGMCAMQPVSQQQFAPSYASADGGAAALQHASQQSAQHAYAQAQQQQQQQQQQQPQPPPRQQLRW